MGDAHAGTELAIALAVAGVGMLLWLLTGDDLNGILGSGSSGAAASRW